MKKILILLNLLIFSFTFSQSEKETIDFINSKFSTYFGDFNYKIEKDNAKNFHIKTIYFGFSNNLITDFTYFNFKNINSITFRKNELNYYAIYINSSENDVKSITQGSNYTSSLSVFFIAYKTYDVVEVNRFVKALKHLFTLYGSKFSNDELFK